jgi:hypothetical protein
VNNEHGFSWTLDRAVAEKLGNRVWVEFDGWEADKPCAIRDPKQSHLGGISVSADDVAPAEIAVRTVAKSEIFAYLNGRDEQEIILLAK